MSSTEKDHREATEIIHKFARNYGGPDARIVFTNGCFDILHPGHVDVLTKCREMAGPRGTVVVGVNSDASVKRLKGEKRPIFDEVTRCEMVAAIVGVDFALTFEEDTPYELLKVLRPHVIVKGGDYKANEVVGADLAVVVIVPTRPGFSTTEAIERIGG